MGYRYEINAGLACNLFDYFSTTKLRTHLYEVNADMSQDNEDICDECKRKVMTHPISMDDSKFSFSFIESYNEVIGYGNFIRYTADIICKVSGEKFKMTIDNFELETNGVIDCDMHSETPREFLAYITEKSIMEYKLRCSKI